MGAIDYPCPDTSSDVLVKYATAGTLLIAALEENRIVRPLCYQFSLITDQNMKRVHFSCHMKDLNTKMKEHKKQQPTHVKDLVRPLRPDTSLVHYAIKLVITKSRKIAKPRDLVLELSDRSQIGRAPRQQGCQGSS